MATKDELEKMALYQLRLEVFKPATSNQDILSTAYRKFLAGEIQQFELQNLMYSMPERSTLLLTDALANDTAEVRTRFFVALHEFIGPAHWLTAEERANEYHNQIARDFMEFKRITQHVPDLKEFERIISQPVPDFAEFERLMHSVLEYDALESVRSVISAPVFDRARFDEIMHAVRCIIESAHEDSQSGTESRKVIEDRIISNVAKWSLNINEANREPVSKGIKAIAQAFLPAVVKADVHEGTDKMVSVSRPLTTVASVVASAQKDMAAGATADDIAIATGGFNP